MRKLLLLSSVCILSAITFAQSDLYGAQDVSETTDTPSVSGSGGGINVEDIGTHSRLENGFEQLYEVTSQLGASLATILTGDASQQTQALQATAAIDTVSQAKNLSALSTNQAIQNKEKATAEVRVRTNNLADYTCVFPTVNSSSGSAESVMRTRRSELSDEGTSILSGEDPKTANGWVDTQRQLFDDALAWCSPAGLGGDAAIAGCTGSINDYLDIGKMLVFNANIGLGGDTSDDTQDVAKLKHLKTLLYGRVPIDIREDLLESPGTNVKNLYVEADRLRAEMGFGMAAFNQVESSRQPLDQEGNSPGYIRQLLTEGDYLKDERHIDALIADGRSSLHAQLDAITMGMNNPNFIQEKIVNNPEIYGATLIYNGTLANRLLFKIMESLEMIQLTLATDLASSRFDEIDQLNRRIEAINSR